MSIQKLESSHLKTAITFAVVASVCAGLLLTPIAHAQAQAGSNVTCDSAGVCSTAPSKTSVAYIDATAVSTTATDICSRINVALNITSLSSGLVVDARGFTTTAALTCAGNPWTTGSATSRPATILLPVGTITVGAPWVLPSGTRLIGIGRDITVISATSSISSDIIEFGSSSTTVCTTSPCTNINVESLTVDGSNASGSTVNGIVNLYGGSGSGIKNVGIKGVTGTALVVGSATNSLANGSGPYANLTVDDTGITTSLGTTCVSVTGLSYTFGFRGINCAVLTTSPAFSAFVLNSNGNVFRDILVTGFVEGFSIGVGTTGKAVGNVIQNMAQSGSSNHAAVRIYGASSRYAVTNLVLMAITNKCVSANNTAACYYTIEDETAPASPVLTVSGFVGVYIVGDPVPTFGSTYALSRFQSDPGGDVTNSAPTWLLAPLGASPGTFTGTCAPGSQMINNTATSGSANVWWVCNSSSVWTNIM